MRIAAAVSVRLTPRGRERALRYSSVLVNPQEFAPPSGQPRHDGCTPAQGDSLETSGRLLGGKAKEGTDK